MNERPFKDSGAHNKTPKYLISSVHGMTGPFVMSLQLQQELFLGPILTQHDFLALMTQLSTFNSRSHILSNFSMCKWRV